MITVPSIIKMLSETDSTISKEFILKANKENATLKHCFQLAYSKNITFNVRRFEPYVKNPLVTIPLSSAFGFAILELAERKVTGNAAVKRLNELYCYLEPEYAEIFKRVILGDLECGTSTAIANKVWPNLIPEQPQHLCQSFSLAKVNKYIDFNDPDGAIAQLKADGARGFCDINEEGQSEILTRAGNAYQGLTQIHTALAKAGLADVVIDGELTVVKTKASDNFIDMLTGEGTEEKVQDRQASNGISNKSIQGTITHQEQLDVVYNVWDITPRDVYYGKQKCVTHYIERYRMLKAIVEQINHPCIKLIETAFVRSYKEARAIYESYIEQDLEGIILKNARGFWKDGRSNDQIKFKVVEPVDMKIIAVYPHKKDPNKVGGFTLVDASGLVKVDCGSGFKDTDTKKVNGKKVRIPLEERHEYDRELLMTMKDRLIGMVCELETNAVVKAKNRKAGEPPLSLFLPIFKKLRYDKNQPNDIRDIFDISKLI